MLTINIILNKRKCNTTAMNQNLFLTKMARIHELKCISQKGSLIIHIACISDPKSVFNNQIADSVLSIYRITHKG